MVLLLFVLWIACGAGAGMIANARGHNGAIWFIVGFVFGPIGLLATLFLERHDDPDEAVDFEGD